MYYIAQVFGILGIIFSTLSMQIKKRKNIIIVLLLLNLTSALNFLFLGFDGNTGCFTSSYVCFFAILETLINYLFERKNKNVPIYMILFYILVNICLGLISYEGIISILSITCAIIFCITLLVKKERNIRLLMLINQSVWLYVDLVTKAYTFSISNILTIISTLIALYRYDYKNNKKIN